MNGNLDVKDLETWKRSELQKLAKEMGLKADGTIKELAARIAAEEVEIPDKREVTDQEPDKSAEAVSNDESEEETPDDEAAIALEVIKPYTDKRLNKIMEKGGELTADIDRANELIAAGVARIKK